MKIKPFCSAGADEQHEESDGERNKDLVWPSNVVRCEMQRCPICLSFLASDVGIPENCYHAFCVTCILKWSETSTSCPIDRKPFQAVFKIDPDGRFTKIQVKPQGLVESRENCCCNSNHCYICCASGKICIRSDANNELENQISEWKTLEKETVTSCLQSNNGYLVDEEKNDSKSKCSSLTTHCSEFFNLFQPRYASTVPFYVNSAEVSEDYEVDLIYQKREELKSLRSPAIVQRIESNISLSTEGGTVIFPVSRPDEYISSSYLSIHKKGFSKRTCVLSSAQEGTEKKQTATGSSNSRGTRKKTAPLSTRRRSTRNSKSEDVSQVPSSPKSSNSDHDTSGCNNSSNVASSDNVVKRTPKRRKRASKRKSQVRKKLRSAAQTQEESSENEEHSANESEKETEKKHKVSGESLSEVEVDTSVMVAKSPCPSLSVNEEQTGSVSSATHKEQCCVDDLPPLSPSSPNLQHSDAEESSSPVFKNGQTFKEILPVSSDSENLVESERENFKIPSDATEPENDGGSDNKLDSEGEESPPSPVSEKKHYSENESPPLKQESEGDSPVPSPASETKLQSCGENVSEPSDENLQDKGNNSLESSTLTKEQDSVDLEVSHLNVEPMIHVSSIEKDMTHMADESPKCIPLCEEKDSKIENSTLQKASDPLFADVVSENEPYRSLSEDKLVLEKKQGGDKQTNGLTECMHETESKMAFEGDCTITHLEEEKETKSTPDICLNSSEIVEHSASVFTKTSTELDALDVTKIKVEGTLKCTEDMNTSTLNSNFEGSPKPATDLEGKKTAADNSENGNRSSNLTFDLNCEQKNTRVEGDDNACVEMDCDSVCSDQHEPEFDHAVKQEENYVKLVPDTALSEKREELNPENKEPKQINNVKIKRKSRFHSPSTMWSPNKSDVNERPRSPSPPKVRESPAKPKSRSRSRDREGDRDNSGQWKGRNRDRRSRRSRSRSRTRSRSRSESRSNIRNRSIASDRSEKDCFSPPWKERWPRENWKGSRGRGDERYRHNERERPSERFRNDWHGGNQDIPEPRHEDKNKNDYPDWVVEKMQSVENRGRGQDRARISHRGSHRGSHSEENQHNSRDSWDKNINLGWNSPRGRGFRGRGGFRGGFGFGDQNENRWSRPPFPENSSAQEPPRFTEHRNYRPKFEPDQFGSPAARSGWSSASSWAVRKTLPADVQNYYSKRGKNTSGSQTGWPKQEESQEPDQGLKDQASQQNEGSQIPVNVMPTQMNVVPQQMNAPPPPQPMNMFPFPIGVHPPPPPPMVNIQHNPQIHNPYNIHPQVPIHLHPGAPLVQASAPTNVPQGLPPPPPPPPPSQQINYITSQPDGKLQGNPSASHVSNNLSAPLLPASTAAIGIAGTVLGPISTSSASSFRVSHFSMKSTARKEIIPVESSADGVKKDKKVQIQEKAAYEVKTAIKPYYQNKDITKEEYKEIVKKAVDKVCHSKSGEVDSAKVANLIKAYVDKYKHSRKKGD